MKALKATLRCVETGEVRVVEQPYAHDVEVADFYWTEGNMACDCNRSIIFGVHIDNAVCSSGRYELLSLTLDGVSVL